MWLVAALVRGPTEELSCEPFGVGLVQALLVVLTAEQAQRFYVVLAHVDPFFALSQ